MNARTELQTGVISGVFDQKLVILDFCSVSASIDYILIEKINRISANN